MDELKSSKWLLDEIYLIVCKLAQFCGLFGAAQTHRLLPTARKYTSNVWPKQHFSNIFQGNISFGKSTNTAGLSNESISISRSLKKNCTLDVSIKLFIANMSLTSVVMTQINSRIWSTCAYVAYIYVTNFVVHPTPTSNDINMRDQL